MGDMQEPSALLYVYADFYSVDIEQLLFLIISNNTVVLSSSSAFSYDIVLVFISVQTLSS